MMNRLRKAMLWLALLLSSCSDKPAPQVGGESHWLAACEVDPDCEDPELSCVCGTCTRKCSGDATCGGGPAAACFDPDSPLLVQRCEARVVREGAGLCLLRCAGDGECGGGRACVQGACVPASDPSQPGEPTLDAGPAMQPGTSTHDYDDVEADVSWSEPVALTTPATAIRGVDERFLGVWMEPRCAEEVTASSEDDWSCVRLTLRSDANGELSGDLTVRFAPDDSRRWNLPGPFAPPTDPDRGWPTELQVAEYARLASSPAEVVTYRMLDGRIEGSTLTFTWSTIDVWRDWCAMQQPYRWEIGGHALQFCVPQDQVEQAGIDEGKMVLCRSAGVEPLCTGADGITPSPCACKDGLGNPRCSPAYCQCDAQRCTANLGLLRRASFTLAVGRLTGTWSQVNPEISLTKVNP